MAGSVTHGAGYLSLPGCLTNLDCSRAMPGCACSRCVMVLF